MKRFRKFEKETSTDKNFKLEPWNPNDEWRRIMEFHIKHVTVKMNERENYVIISFVNSFSFFKQHAN